MDLATPTVIDENTEHYRAAFWRRRIMLLQVGALAELTGYARRTIWRFESGEKVDPRAFQRYKLTCAGLHAHMRGWTQGDEFNWRV
jgi:hypothetical protein